MLDSFYSTEYPFSTIPDVYTLISTDENGKEVLAIAAGASENLNEDEGYSTVSFYYNEEEIPFKENRGFALSKYEMIGLWSTEFRMKVAGLAYNYHEYRPIILLQVKDYKNSLT
mmetsp:Transcript_39349/g.37785  ORF Transcript_39349/g.37785 Transcript_39349/m.37785 type:complete len:114 (+) Transcript_39349:848-1189(+)|eukprot:CAMPEP_0170544558 /NCGR_PEP_ID=MMETSP0211-20121228/3271_1 /TAXON_ID=311385 /ORGANISM="Pseudokeronopsis sp., Strain OXSARD2" /LENGTH=113 /DNA_ID=CAMNT_0010848233 /DNA_START=762 /DNA_END=1103 /DNA_ORIENTATION=-